MALLDRADVGDDGAGLEAGGGVQGRAGDGGGRGGEDDEVGAGRGLGGGVEHLVGVAEFADALAHGGAGVMATVISATAFLARAARMTEEPIRPQPMTTWRDRRGTRRVELMGRGSSEHLARREREGAAAEHSEWEGIEWVAGQLRTSG